DVGPGNTLMNQYAKMCFSKDYDENGTIAASGQVNEKLLTSLLAHPFFLREFPKTTGPELFNLSFLSEAQSRSNTRMIDEADVMATLCSFTAKCIAKAILPIKRQYENVCI